MGLLPITKKSSKRSSSYHVRTMFVVMFGQGFFYAFFGFETGLKSGVVAWLVQGRWYGADNIKV